jgi:hypothetical protein
MEGGVENRLRHSFLQPILDTILDRPPGFSIWT